MIPKFGVRLFLKKFFSHITRRFWSLKSFKFIKVISLNFKNNTEFFDHFKLEYNEKFQGSKSSLQLNKTFLTKHCKNDPISSISYENIPIG